MIFLLLKNYFQQRGFKFSIQLNTKERRKARLDRAKRGPPYGVYRLQEQNYVDYAWGIHPRGMPHKIY